ncbi:hypothetical protein C8Q80DRAFT_1265787 [Daedaleopsis nitida]|nr:hypothetical protein C8Q80DRAFT_1265787 [Daedaleopsis nitida]
MDKELDIASMNINSNGSSLTLNGKVIALPPVDYLSKSECHGCGESKEKPSDLKKCAGCSVAIYCSRECQKEAWSQHKYASSVHTTFFCTGSSSTQTIKRALADELVRAENASTLPTCTPKCIDSPIAGIASFQRYVNLHTWSFETLCQVSCPRNTPRPRPVLALAPAATDLKPKPKPKPPPPPTQSQQVKNDPTFRQVWAEHRPALEAELASLKAEHGERFIGILPVTALVHSTFMILHMFVPIFSLYDPDALQDAEARRALEDLQTLCVGCMNMGMPLAPFGTCKQVAIPARPVWNKAVGEWGCRPEGTRERPFDDRCGHYELKTWLV